MKLIEVEISLESILNREYPVYSPESVKTIDVGDCVTEPLDIKVPEIFTDNPAFGTIDVSYLHLPVFLEKSCDDMGFFSDFSFIPLVEFSGSEISVYYRLPQTTESDYYSNTTGEFISGYTTNYLSQVVSYSANNPYVENLNLSIFDNTFTGVLELTENYITYVINGQLNILGNYVQDTGLILTTYFNETVIYYDSILKSNVETLKTTFRCRKAGWNSSNVALYQNVKEEQYFGQVEPPKENYDVSIDRNNLSVLEPSLRLAEISTLQDLVLYNRKYYSL